MDNFISIKDEVPSKLEKACNILSMGVRILQSYDLGVKYRKGKIPKS